MDWKTMLAYVTGSVDENLLLRIEYLVAENRILRDQIKGRLQLSDAERQTLAEIGARLGKQALAEVATIVQPDTILGWNRKLAARSSMAPSSVNPWVGPASTRNSRTGSFAWRRRIAAGAMIALPAPWPSWVTTSATRRWAISSNAVISRQPQSAGRPRRGENSSVVTWM